MTDRTLRISARMAEEIQQWASDELSQWPRDTAYVDDLENLLSQLTAAAPAPDAVARLVEAAKWVRDQSCEGFCRDLPRDDYYDKEMDIDCAGCRVRAALAAMETSHDRT